MKKITIMSLLTLAVLAMLATLPVVTTGCKTTQVGTNIVTTLDPVRVQQIADVVEPAASSVLRRVIARSPQHAVQIGNYARAVGGVFCKMSARNNFTVTYLVDASNEATAGLQAGVDQDIIDIKNAVIAIYKVAASDHLTWQLPDNVWLRAVANTICNSINQALLDSGQIGCK
jgi:hypothetical protein